MNRQSRTCSVEGCDRPYYAKGFCASHYQRNRLLELKKRRLEQSGGSGTMEPKTDPVKSCAAWLCDRPVYGMGLCQYHYESWNMDRFGAQTSEDEQESSERP